MTRTCGVRCWRHAAAALCVAVLRMTMVVLLLRALLVHGHRTCRKPSLGSHDKLVRKLGPEHVKFLTSLHTLEQWSGLTMKQRTVLFHRRFTDKRIAVTSLRRLYLRHGIRCKKVRLEKSMTQRVRRNFVQNC